MIYGRYTSVTLAGAAAAAMTAGGERHDGVEITISSVGCVSENLNVSISPPTSNNANYETAINIALLSLPVTSDLYFSVKKTPTKPRYQ